MQAHSFFIGGIPMLFYGDEAAYTNDYSYLNDPGKSYDNRWMHRPVINWEKNKKIEKKGTIEQRVFSATQKLIAIRKKIFPVGDYKNLAWLTPHDIHVAGYLRTFEEQKLYCLFNFLDKTSRLTWHVFKEHGEEPVTLFDHWQEKEYRVGLDQEYLEMEPYQFLLMKVK
jgi:amylosucrase